MKKPKRRGRKHARPIRQIAAGVPGKRSRSQRRVECPAKSLPSIGEVRNDYLKAPGSVPVRFALAFPDTYAIGMSHLGLQILYSILNARDDTAAERVGEQLLRQRGDEQIGPAQQRLTQPRRALARR